MDTAVRYVVGCHDFRNFCKMDVANGVLKYERRILSAKVKVLAMDQFHKDVDTLSGLLPLKCFYYSCTHIRSDFFSIKFPHFVDTFLNH
jgi:hypothetical protein